MKSAVENKFVFHGNRGIMQMKQFNKGKKRVAGWMIVSNKGKMYDEAPDTVACIIPGSTKYDRPFGTWSHSCLARC